jgi:hypothetical protein
MKLSKMKPINKRGQNDSENFLGPYLGIIPRQDSLPGGCKARHRNAKSKVKQVPRNFSGAKMRTKIKRRETMDRATLREFRIERGITYRNIMTKKHSPMDRHWKVFWKGELLAITPTQDQAIELVREKVRT